MKRIYLSLALMLLFFGNCLAQSLPESPQLAFVCELKIKLNPALVVGETPHGVRRIVTIIGGTIEGPEIKGEVLTGGADWQIVRTDGVAEIEAHYQIKTSDGVVVYIKNTGIRTASPEVAARLGKGEQVDPSEYYFRAVSVFEAPKGGKYAWLNNAVFICKGIKNPDGVVIQVWKVK